MRTIARRACRRCRRAVRALAAIIPRRRTGPGPGHPESVTAGLAEASEQLLAALDAELWPRQARARRRGLLLFSRRPQTEEI